MFVQCCVKGTGWVLRGERSSSPTIYLPNTVERPPTPALDRPGVMPASAAIGALGARDPQRAAAAPHNSGAPPVTPPAAPSSCCSRTFPPRHVPPAPWALPGRPGEGAGRLRVLGISQGGTGSPSPEGTQGLNRAGIQGQAANTSLKTVAWC